MNKKPMIIGCEFENDTYYFFDKERLEVSISDTTRAYDEMYRSITKKPPCDWLDTAFLLKDKKNVTLDFGGATIYLRGKIQPFIIDNCENVTVKNCIIQYDRSFVSEFEILERGEDYILIKPSPNHPCRVEDGTIVSYSDTWENRYLDHGSHFIQTFDKETHEGWGLMLAIVGDTVYQDPNAFAPGEEYAAEQVGENIKLKGRPDNAWQVGRIITDSSEPRVRSSVAIINSSDVHIESYRIINGSGMGLLPLHSKNIFIDGLVMTCDEKSPGIVTNAADAIHAIACSGKFEITNSIIEGMIDDAINIHSNFFTVDSSCGNTLRISSSGWLTARCNILDAGDKIAVYKPFTMEKLAEYTVLERKPVDLRLVDLVLDRPTDSLEKGSLVENLTGNSDITLKNCRIGKANSHMRFQSRGKVLIEDCEIGIRTLLTGDASYWFESSPCTDFTVRSCKFTRDAARFSIMPEVLPTEKEPYYHKNLRFENCSFTSDIPVSGHQADNIVFVNNTNSLGRAMRLELTNCGDVTCDCAEVIKKTEKKESLSRN